MQKGGILDGVVYEQTAPTFLRNGKTYPLVYEVETTVPMTFVGFADFKFVQWGGRLSRGATIQNTIIEGNYDHIGLLASSGTTFANNKVTCRDTMSLMGGFGLQVSCSLLWLEAEIGLDNILIEGNLFVNCGNETVTVRVDEKCVRSEGSVVANDNTYD